MSSSCPLRALARSSALVAVLALVQPWSFAQTPAETVLNPSTSGPLRLRQATPMADSLNSPRTTTDREADRDRRTEPMRQDPGTDNAQLPTPRVRLSEFEIYVRRLAGQAAAPLTEGVRRLGVDLVTETREISREGQGSQDALPMVPSDYAVGPGDELLVSIWGSVEAELRLTVDRTGRIQIPRVGAVMVSGVRMSELGNLLTQRASQVFRNFQLSATLGKVRQIRVYVSGFASRPGSYVLSGLSTLTTALIRAGGPAPSGSFRNIQLRRAGKVVAQYDLYDLIVKGDNSGDLSLQAEDVIHIGAIGPQAAVVGSVNKAAVLEIKPNETLDDLLRMVGGMTAVADRTRAAVERLDDRNETRIAQLALPEGLSFKPGSGDVVRVFSAVTSVLPVERQNKRVRVEGEVARPGEYILPPNSTIGDAVRAAGGFTASAFLYGTEFRRESVRATQQLNYDRALRDLETDLARNAATLRTSNADEAAAQNARSQSISRLVDGLRQVRPNGRVVLQLSPDAQSLPDLTLEDSDHLLIPPRPTSVGVFGSVFNAGSYLYASQRLVDDYLRLAGGPTRGADTDSVFVLRANGTVFSNLQRSTSLFGGRGEGPLGNVPALPGDTIFVPEEMNKTSTMQHVKDWAQIFSQFGLGLAAIRSLTN